MIYLSGSAAPEAQPYMLARRIGFFAQPDIGNAIPPGIIWAADNGCFSPKRFTFERWERWLDRQRRDALWATVPDVILDHAETLARWTAHVDTVKELGFKAAFCAQDGCVTPPSDADCLFLGGTTAWKTSDAAMRLTHKAQDMGMTTHMGRVNSYKRLRIAFSWGCDTADGTFIARAPTENMTRVLRWLDKLDRETAKDVYQNPDECSWGHPLVGENLRTDTRGKRRCGECDRTRWRKTQNDPGRDD